MGSHHFVFSGDRVALIVRGKTAPAHEPELMAQHADCVLSTGAPVGFFGEGSDGGSSGQAPSSIGGSGRSSVARSNASGLAMAGAVYDLDRLRQKRPYYVDAAMAKGYDLVSTVLLVQCSVAEAQAFDQAWADMAASPGSFQLLGWNCSTHASKAFRAAGILSGGIPGLDTPNNLYKQLCTERGGKVMSVSGYVGFSAATGATGRTLTMTVESA